jgi:hypothetical protein
MKRAVAPFSSAIAAAAVTVVVFVAPGGRPSAVGEGQARLVPAGVVEVAVGGQPYRRITEPRLLHRGDRARVVAGRATLELPRAARAELRRSSAVRVGSSGGAALTLEGGDVLAEAPGTTTTIDGGSAIAAVRAGAAKLSRSASLLTGTYDGVVILRAGGRALEVPRLRQAITAGRSLLPSGVAPLEISADDEWDRRYLGRVLELDRQLVSYGRGFQAQLSPVTSETPSLYRTLVPPLASFPLTPETLAGRTSAENLIGLVLVSLDRGDLEGRLAHVFGLREQGARWGLVAFDRELAPDAVLALVARALAILDQILFPKPPTPGRAPAPASSANQDRQGGVTQPSPTPEPSPPPGPIVSTPPTPADPILEQGTDIVDRLIEDVLGLSDGAPALP